MNSIKHTLMGESTRPVEMNTVNHALIIQWSNFGEFIDFYNGFIDNPNVLIVFADSIDTFCGDTLPFRRNYHLPYVALW